MPTMSMPLALFCRSRVYRVAAGRLTLPWALQGVRPTGSGLEIGSGSGAMAARLLAAFPDLRLKATDLDPAMVASARRRLARFGERAGHAIADAAELPYEDGRFDLVASFGMLHHVTRWQRALGEAVRVLRPGGRLIGYDVLDTRPVRWVHHLAGTGEVVLFGPGRLAEVLSGLPVTDVRVRPAAGGTLVRFSATASEAPVRSFGAGIGRTDTADRGSR